MRLAMWSGPRNISTACMYAFAQRADFAVVDEPFYAAYLAKTGLDHPMRAEIMAAQPADPAEVVARLTGPVPGGRRHFYLKLMSQHMVGGMPTGWMGGVAHAFLIRHPARVVASFAAKYEDPTADDLGFRRQAELYDSVRALGQEPPVLDSVDIRADPGAMLAALCEMLRLEFDPAMLSWPKGGNRDDGVWAAHWYGAVHRSTGFAGAEGPLPQLTGRAAELAEEAMPHYRKLAENRIRV